MVVFDTNIWVSGLIYGGRCRTLMAGVIERRYGVAVSEPLLAELGDVLSGRKFRYSPEVVAAILQDIRTMALMVHPRVTVRAVHDDPDDDRVLECALASGAHYIVSGDRHLLKMGKFRGIKIVDPAAFAREIHKPGDDLYRLGSEGTGPSGPPTVNETVKKYRIRKRSRKGRPK